jgi:MerR family transcriptional regulator, light-induced transcriptional regulator
MNEKTEISAKMLLCAARTLGGYAAGELLESRPAVPASSGQSAFSMWQDLLTRCLEALAASIAVDRPQLFVRHMQWLQGFLRARGIDDDALAASLECLQRILAAELPEPSAMLAADVCQEAARGLNPEVTLPEQLLTTDTVCGRLAGRYLLALLEGDRSRATRLIVEAADAGLPRSDLYLQVLLPALEEAGRMWHAAEINVAEEHFATAATRSVMAQLRAGATVRPPNGKTLVAAAVAGNLHDVGLQAVADFFEMDGWRVIQLGANVPIGDLVEAVGFYEADLVALSVGLSTQIETLKRTIERVRRADRGEAVKILVGGHGLAGFGDLAVALGADGFAADPAEAVALGNAMAFPTPDKPAVQSHP